MKRLLAVCLFGGVLAGCSVQPITCDAAHPCAIGTCDTKHDPPICSLAQGACFPLCQKYEACISSGSSAAGKCTPQGPAITAVNAPKTWSRRSDSVTVTAVVDGSQGPGIGGAALKISGQQDVTGTTADTGNVRTYSFTVPGTVQAQNSESPVNFTIVATDIENRPTLPTGVGTGQLLIDDVPPAVVSGVTLVPAGVLGTGPIAWFKPGPGTIDAQVIIRDAGSGVDTSTLTLVSGGTRFDTGTPSCAQQATKDTYLCHFSISQSQSGVTPGSATTGVQKRFDFAVAGFDTAKNPIAVNTAALGLDGRPPTITFSVGATGTTTYPGTGLDCAGDVQACGHDGSHFWRAGDGQYTLKFTVDDAYASARDGSGTDPNSSTCTIQGVPTCTVTYDSTSGTFRFPAEFKQATVTTAADGTGTVSSITVTAKDLAGNSAADVTLSGASAVAITRVKWVRKEAVNIATPPVLSAQMKLLIVGGSVTSNDSIFAINTTNGSQAWKAGSASPAVGTITGSLALDTTPSTDPNHLTPVLYANGGTQAFAMHFTSSGIDKYCSQAPSTTSMVGSPVIVGGGASAYAIAASQDTLVAFQTAVNTGGGCLRPTFYPATVPSPSPIFGPPSANGNTVYWSYDNSSVTNPTDFGVKSIGFNGSFDAAAKSANLGFAPTNNSTPSLAAVTPASDILFGVNSQVLFYDYSADLTGANSTSYKWKSQAGLSAVYAQPVVSNNIVYGATKALYAYKNSDGTYAWTNPAVTGSSRVSAPTLAANTLFVADDSSPPKIASYDLTGKSNWSYAPTGATAIGTIATEATLGPDGVLYFGDAVGHIYALFSDATPLAPAAGDWPRTGYDNCNSNHGGSNPGFVCQ